MHTRYVLSIDGGGIYGIIPATWCVVIERETGQSIGASFDLLTGTSTGSVLSAGFTTGHSADLALDFYMTQAPQIFSNPRPKPTRFFRPKYKAKYMRDALNKYFGDKTLGEVDPKLMITAFDMNTYTPEFFKSWADHEKGIRVADAVAASSSAPTFHPMHRISNVCYIDGGLFAENPAMCALAEARKLWPNDEIVLVSMGTGLYTQSLECKDKNRQWGQLKWASEVPTVFLEGARDMVKYQLDNLVPFLPGVTHFRFNVNLEQSKHADETNPERLKAIRDLAQREADTNAQFDFLIEVLKGYVHPTEGPPV